MIQEVPFMYAMRIYGLDSRRLPFFWEAELLCPRLPAMLRKESFQTPVVTCLGMQLRLESVVTHIKGSVHSDATTCESNVCKQWATQQILPCPQWRSSTLGCRNLAQVPKQKMSSLSHCLDTPQHNLKSVYRCEGCVHRDVVAPSLQAVGDAADALRSKGFVNYFGLQRFGAGVNATHQ